MYSLYKACLEQTPKRGAAVELGSGAGFAKLVVPELITTDILPYDGVDAVVDGTRMPFANQSIRFVCMWNVLHHIPDAEALFRELDRSLLVGGRVLILDQHVGWISRWVLQYLHHEPFRADATEWAFATDGPLSGANGALAWIVFQRDRDRFRRLFPRLRIRRYRPHTPLRFWLAGGLKKWSLIPPGTWKFVTALDRLLIQLSPQLGSFVLIELEKVENANENPA
ncbi:MAG: class I SAM-dependent methyltransferase [Bryobacteraceae bacterium]